MIVVERVVAVVTLALGSILFNSAFRLDHRAGNWLGASLIATGQIVLGSEVLSELHAIGLPGFLGVHLVFLIGSILLARWKGTCPRIDDYVVSLAEIAAFARTHKLVVAFGLSLSTILILVVLPTSFVTGDAAHYHLPRAQYWIENQTARHFFTDYFPQVEYPPNTSFLYMWQIIVAGNYVALNLAQWVAAILTSMAIFALSIHGGHNSASSLFAGLIYLSLSGVVLQMSTPYDDILTAWLAASLIFFTLLAIDKFVSGRVDTARTYLLYSGMAFGLYLGAKLTAVFLLPGFGAVVAVALLRARANLVRNSILVGTGLLAGFLVFGSYNYVLNCLDFGNPIASPAAMQSQLADIVQKNDPVADASARNPLANFVRDLYQVMDWKIVKPIPGADTGYLYNRFAYHAADHALHLHLESLREFNLVAFGMRDITPGAIGFGPIGYVVFLGSIVFLPLALWWRNKSWRLRFSLLLLAIGFGWIFAFCALLPWESSRLRFFAVPISIFVAAVVPFAYSQRRIAWLWLVPAMGLALWTAGQTALISRDLSDSQASLEDWQVELLQRALPDEAELGTSRGVEFIHYLSHFPAYEFTPVPRIEIPERLRSGELDAALVLEPDSALAPFVLPFERGQSLLVPDPKRVLLANSDLYGVKLHSSGGEWKVSLVNSALVQRLGPDLVRIFLPATGAVTTGGPLHVEIGFPVEPPGKDALSLLCGGKRVTFQIKDSTVEADLPALKLPQNQAYLYCEVRISDHTFGNQVPSSSISVIAESQAHP